MTRKIAALLLLSFSCARAADLSLSSGSTAPMVSTGADAQVENVRTLLTADDAKGALAAAEAAVAAGGGADAYAARAEAERALGRPAEQAIADYAKAASLDPRYQQQSQGFLAQLDSDSHPDKSKSRSSRGMAGISMFFVGLLAAAGLVLIVVGCAFMIRKKSAGKSSSEL